MTNLLGTLAHFWLSITNLKKTPYMNIWMEKGCPQNIIIEDQHMECQGQLRIKRFGDPGYSGHDGKPWDGIHMRGRLAIRHYTNSVIRILSDICQTKSQSPQQPFHSTCPQSQYQSRQQRNYRDADNFQFRRKYRNNYRRTQTQQADNNGGHKQYRSLNSGFNIGVSNRFNSLGNY